MADKKITQLPSLSFISGSTTGWYPGEVVLPIVHNSTTVKIEAQKFALYATQWSATTASNTFIGNQTINGNVVVTGKLTAQELHTEITSASIIFESGSTIFGNTADDTHTITGTININGNVVGNAPLDFTSQSLNVQTGSQELINVQNSIVTSSLNLATASLNFTTGALNIASGSYNRLYQVTSSVHSTTASLNQATSSLNFASGALEIASGSYNRFYQATASIHSTTSSLNQATSSLNFASGALEIATGSYNRFYDMTSSVHSTTQSLNVQTGSQELINVQNSTVSSSLNLATASINFTTGALNSFTGSIISQTNTIATFTSSVNFATSSLNAQTGSQNNLNAQIGIATASLNTQTGSQGNLNAQIGIATASLNFTTQSLNTQTGSQQSMNTTLSIVTGSMRAEIGGIEAYTASLKSAIVVSGNNVRIIGELTASRIYTEFITSSVLFVTGSNIIGDQPTDKHEFTGSVNIADTLFIKGQAIGLGELNSFTGSQIGKDGTLAIVTSSLRAEIGGIESYTASLKGQAIVSSSTQIQNYDVFALNSNLYNGTGSIKAEVAGIESYTASLKAEAIVSSSTQVQNYDVFALNSNLYISTGSIKAEIGGIELYTASLKAAAIVSSSTQVQNYDLFALNSNLYNSTGSIKGEIAGIEAYTASLKGAAIVSSSQQVQNYFTFAQTASANTFYGNQSISGSVGVNKSSNGGSGNDFPRLKVQNSLPTQGDGSTTFNFADILISSGNEAVNMFLATTYAAGTWAPSGIINVATNHGLQIKTNNTTALNVAAGGDVTVSTGNLVMGTSGKGIDFSATSNSSGTMTSELLNDYEEGTWTPTVRGSATAGTYELATDYTTYTKIGRQVTISGNIRLGTSITGGGTGYLQITGLPFGKAANTAAMGAVALNGVDFTGSYVTISFTSVSASSILYLSETIDNNTPTDLPISAVSANDEIVFTITYFN